MTKNEALEYRKKVVDGEKVEAMGGFEVSIELSDKVGQNWRIVRLNGVEVMKEYVAQDIPMGTESNPIVWKPTMNLIVNAFYTNGGKRYVAIKKGSPETITEEYFTEF